MVNLWNDNQKQIRYMTHAHTVQDGVAQLKVWFWFKDPQNKKWVQHRMRGTPRCEVMSGDNPFGRCVAWQARSQNQKFLDNEKGELPLPNGAKAGLTAFTMLINAGHSVKSITLKNPHLREVCIGYQKGP
jgi:hypothetical protein